MEAIAGPVTPLQSQVISKLFPMFDSSLLSRKNSPVDILVGLNYYGLHPRQELAQSGKHLCVMRGDFGMCIQGTHPELDESTQYDSSLFHCTARQKTNCRFAGKVAHPGFRTFLQ